MLLGVAKAVQEHPWVITLLRREAEVELEQRRVDKE